MSNKPAFKYICGASSEIRDAIGLSKTLAAITVTTSENPVLRSALPTELTNDVVTAFGVAIVIALEVVAWVREVDLVYIEDVDQGAD